VASQKRGAVSAGYGSTPVQRLLEPNVGFVRASPWRRQAPAGRLSVALIKLLHSSNIGPTFHVAFEA